MWARPGLAGRALPGVSGLTQAVVQVSDPISLNDLRVVQQQRGSRVVAEVPDTGTEHDRYQVHTHLVDQPGLDCLPADVARADRDVLVSGEGRRLRHGAAHAVGDEGEGCVRKVPVGRRLVRHHEHSFADRWAAVPAVRIALGRTYLIFGTGRV